jgi:hypothetical protein
LARAAADQEDDSPSPDIGQRAAVVRAFVKDGRLLGILPRIQSASACST